MTDINTAASGAGTTDASADGAGGAGTTGAACPDGADTTGTTGAARPDGGTAQAAQRSRGPVAPTAGAAVTHVPLGGPTVRLISGLLRDWQRRSLTVSLPLALRQLEQAGNLENMRLAASATAPGPMPYRGPVFADSDIYKTLEAIGWELGHGERPNPGGPNPGSTDLASFSQAVTELLSVAQRPDGYLDSYYQVTGEPRYEKLASSHEMYCAAHLIQAAIAHHRTTGQEKLLAVATRLADHLVAEFAGRHRGLDGHPIIETALTELYRETGSPDFLSLASQFVEQRGRGLAGDSGRGHRYLSDYVPVRQAETVDGHVVRALYLEAGVVDVAAETGDRELLESSIRRWDDMIATKTYLTGGNGSRHSDEGFGDRYELPPDRAYNETCAAIASFQWSWRLLLATGAAKYAEHMERVLYNAFGAAISAQGDRFFYVNPLQRREDHVEGDDPGRRHEWFSCACCPPNIMRLLASLEHYLATVSGDWLYIHQFAGARLAGAGLDVSVITEYPWSGLVQVQILSAPAAPRGLALRIPSWSRSTRLRINNSSERTVVPGYHQLRRQWVPGDVVTLELDMTPRWTYPDRRVDAVRGCAAIERGPLVYCFEQADQLRGVSVEDLTLRTGVGDPGPLAGQPVRLPGVGATIAVTAEALRLPPVVPDGLPYTSQPAADGPAASASATATALPYFQWDNRDGGAMRVWMPLAAPVSPNTSARRLASCVCVTHVRWPWRPPCSAC